MDHLLETAAHFASDNMLAPCRHDTWAVTKHHAVTDEPVRARPAA
jgi:hypothetical protein